MASSLTGPLSSAPSTRVRGSGELGQTRCAQWALSAMPVDKKDSTIWSSQVSSETLSWLKLPIGESRAGRDIREVGGGRLERMWDSGAYRAKRRL